MSITPAPQIRGLSGWKPLARGGLATVWQARQLAQDRLVAVKVYERPLHESDPQLFVREASAGSRLGAHPGIVRTYSVGILSDNRPYLVLELCPGGSLSSWLQPERRPSEERVRQVGLRVADALAAAHAAGVLHRDVKPANILLDRHDQPRLADFGLVVQRGARSDPGDRLWFTPAYAPPEVFGMEPLTEAGDVFSLAATLYALLAGHPPRDVGPECAPFEELVRAAQEPILPIPWCSRPLMDVLLAALDDDPSARPSAATFFGQLARVPLRPARRGAGMRGAGPVPELAPREVATAPPVPVDAPAETERRPDRLLVLAAVLAVVVVGAGGWLVRQPDPSGAAAPVAQGPVAGGPPSSAEPPRPADLPSPADQPIRVSAPVEPAKPYQAARIQGTYAGGSGTFLRVQRWEEGAWLTFPVPAKTDVSGAFVAYVELGQPGRYRLRVLDPGSGVKSEPVVLEIRA